MKKLLLILSLMTLSVNLFSAVDSRYDAGLNMPFNQKAGEVNPQTGNVTINSADVSLPGRAGMNFSFGRVWNLNSSNVFAMDVNPNTGHNRLSSNTPEDHHRLGVGWSSSIPYLHEDINTNGRVLHLFFSGNAYQIDLGNVSNNNSALSNILGYDLLDKRVYAGTWGAEVSYRDFTGTKPINSADEDFESSKYVLILKDNSKYYFRADGSLMMNQDPSALNRIWYFYNSEDVLTTVVDTVGREINFNYDSNGNLSEINWKVEVWEKDNTGVRSEVKSTRRVKYGYSSAANIDEVKSIISKVQNYKEPYSLVSVTNPMGLDTRYDYTPGSADFSFNKMFSQTNVYLMLSSIKQNFVSIEGKEKYSAAKFYEYSVPEKGMFKRYFYSGFMEYYKVSRIYNHDIHKNIKNDTGYTYFDSKDTNSNQYSTRMQVGGAVTAYYYSTSDSPTLLNVLTTIETETSDGFSEQRSFVYDKNKTKTLEQVYRRSLIYQEKFMYDQKGNLIELTDKSGLIIKRDYDPIYSIPVKEFKTVTYGSDKRTYQREWEVNSTGQVTKSILFVDSDTENPRHITEQTLTYDSYGNVIAVTDAAGNTQHTVFDTETNTYPLYTWGKVTIDKQEADWKITPISKELVEVGTRSLYNTDGTVYMQFDVDGNAIEHFYDKLGREIETISPMDDDDTSWYKSLTTTDIDVAKDPSFTSYLTDRKDNPGSKTIIDDVNAYIKTVTDLDKANNKTVSTAVQSDGLDNPEEEYTYNKDGTVRGVTKKTYDAFGRMLSITDPDASESIYSFTEVNKTSVKQHDKTWLIEYDDLGRKIKIIYPRTSSKTDIKYITYNDYENSVTTVDPEKRTSYVRSDWAGNIEEASNYGFDSTLTDTSRSYAFSYDSAGRKRVFTDALGEETLYEYNERDQLVKQTYGGTGSDIMDYNDLGLLTKKTDRKMNVIATEYDEAGRPTIMTRTYPNGTVDEVTRLSYNRRGLGWRIEGKNLTEYSEFDVKGALVKHSRYLKNSTLRTQSNSALTQTNESYAFIYNYTDSGLLKSMTYPDGGVHAFDYENGTGYLKEISEAGNPFANNFIYNKSGVVESMSWENGVTQRWNFDNRKRISDLVISRASEDIEHLKYTLNGVGDVTAINSNQYSYNGFGEITGSRTLIPGSVDQISMVEKSFGALNNDVNFNSPTTYTIKADFNSDNRIDGADHHAAFLNDIKVGTYDDEEFTYDKAGNRTSLIQNGKAYTYHYIEGKRNQLDSITGENFSINYEYDANGNTIKKTEISSVKTDTTEYTYDTLNRLIKTSSVTKGTCEYFYDNANNRFVKDIGNNKTIYLRQGAIAVAMDIELEGSTGNSIINRYVLSGDLIAGRISTKNTVSSGITTKTIERNYYHLDHLNSTKVVTDKDAKVVVKYEYRAFGEQLKKLNEDNAETGDLAKYSYGGKELDDENDLYYFNARYYDATIGRFINVDPIQDGTNWYIYCNNNPLNMVDPTGLENKGGVFGFKLSVSLGWMTGGTAEVKVAFDSDANLSLSLSGGWGAMPPNVSALGGPTISNAPNVYAESGWGGTTAASFSAESIAAASESNRYYTEDGYYLGTSALIGGGVGWPAGISQTESKQYVFGANLPKIFEAGLQLFDNSMEALDALLCGDIENVSDLGYYLGQYIENPFGYSDGDISLGEANNYTNNEEEEQN